MSNTYINDNQKKTTSLRRISKSDNINLQEKNTKINQHNSHSLSGLNNENKDPNEILSELLDNLNKNSLNLFYKDSSSNFKKKIDELNLKFYLETEKYLSNQNKQEKTQSSLFIILFKQIKIYIEEIERLNLIILEKKYNIKSTIERTDEILQKQKKLETNQKLIKILKDSKSHTEGKLLETLLSEDKLKKENEKLKQENEFFKKQSLITKNLTQSVFYSKTFNNFRTNERINSDITKANSNLSNENTIEFFSNKKRNNSENNNNSITFNPLINNYNEPRKNLGIIKSVKEKIKKEKKFNSGNINDKKNCEFYNLNNKPSQINISNNNTIQELDYISEFKNLDFNGNNNNKLMKRPEIIVSDLEDYYKNNQLLFQNNDSNETFNNNNQIALNKDNYKNNYHNKIYNSSNNKKFNNNNNKKIIQKKIPIIKVKMN